MFPCRPRIGCSEGNNQNTWAKCDESCGSLYKGSTWRWVAWSDSKTSTLWYICDEDFMKGFTGFPWLTPKWLTSKSFFLFYFKRKSGYLRFQWVSLADARIIPPALFLHGYSSKSIPMPSWLNCGDWSNIAIVNVRTYGGQTGDRYQIDASDWWIEHNYSYSSNI
jgi:hypothetical protein